MSWGSLVKLWMETTNQLEPVDKSGKGQPKLTHFTFGLENFGLTMCRVYPSYDLNPDLL